MQAEECSKIKEKLDQNLVGADPKIGILLGDELFKCFRDNGWLTLEEFGVLGSTFFESQIVAYGRTHPVSLSWDLASTEFEVGKQP